MTGALTALVEALSTGRARGVEVPAAVGLVTLVAGAASSALLVEHASRVALLTAGPRGTPSTSYLTALE
jgi:hypothetical protein